MLPEFRIATHPGQILLAEFLEPLRLTQAELARALRIPLNRINELVRGKRGITPETAPSVARAGANALVAGSAVFKGGTPESYRANIAAIRNAAALARGEAA